MADTNRSAIVKEFLKYVFSEPEMKEFATDLARKTSEMSEAEESKKAVVAQFGERIASLRAETSSLARRFNSGYEYRNIECRVLYHDPSPAQKTIVRLDTGEIVKVAAMSHGELQEILPFKDEQPAVEAAATDVPADVIEPPAAEGTQATAA
ncbi:MAG TPA: hypothetical protein VGP89_18145 [Candidatus Angelobacter sp.]|jgi:hypothetical protein|nr:hypothetical protein [Candidatus Angelobacter sp.]